jgi:hypothetical protein
LLPASQLAPTAVQLVPTALQSQVGQEREENREAWQAAKNKSAETCEKKRLRSVVAQQGGERRYNAPKQAKKQDKHGAR